MFREHKIFCNFFLKLKNKKKMAVKKKFLFKNVSWIRPLTTEEKSITINRATKGDFM